MSSADYQGKIRDELIFELVKRKYDEETERSEKLDNKANNLIGFISIVIGILMTEGFFKISSILKNANVESLLIVYVLGLAIMLISIGNALHAFKIRTWDSSPGIKDLMEKYTVVSYQAVLVNVIDDISAAYTKNFNNNQKKANSIKLSWYLLIGGLSILFAFLVITIITVDIPISPV